jgi:hypothetical protein
MARPVCKGFVQGSLTQSASTYPACGKTPAKMEIRASQSSYNTWERLIADVPSISTILRWGTTSPQKSRLPPMA